MNDALSLLRLVSMWWCLWAIFIAAQLASDAAFWREPDLPPEHEWNRRADREVRSAYRYAASALAALAVWLWAFAVSFGG